MTEAREEFDKFIAALKQQRDELNLQIHLAKAETREEWAGLEAKWAEVQGKTGQLRSVSGEVAGEVGAAARLLAEEIGRGYERIRKLF